MAIRTDEITDQLGTGAPDFPQGLTINGQALEASTAGSGEINYIDNWNFESNLTGWATSNNAAVASPAAAAGVTIALEETTVLRELRSLKIDKPASVAQDDVYYDFTIKTQDISKKLKIQFDFKTDEIAEYSTGDLTVLIYDVTNDTIITPSDTTIIRGQNIFQTSFNSTTSTSYRLIFRVADAGSDDWTAYIDNVIVGPGMTSQGAAIGPWITFTPAWSGLTSTSTNTGHYRRVGDSMEILTQTIASAAVSTTIQLTIPESLTINSSVAPTTQHVGTAWAFGDASGNVRYTGLAYTTSTTQVAFTMGNGSANNFDAATPFTWANTDLLTTSITVPITEWAGKGIVPMLAEDNLSEWQAYPGTLNGFGSATNDLEYRKVGDTLELQGSVTAGSVSFPQSIDLPSGLTAAAATSNDIIVGTFDRTVAHQKRNLLAANGDTSIAFGGYDGGGVNPLTPDTASNICNNSEIISVQARVQIQEWAGSQNSLVGYSEATENNAGLLKAYDEGTWTPTNGSHNNLTGTGAYTSPRYTKIGNMVFVTISDITGLTVTSDATRTWMRIDCSDLPGFSSSTEVFGSCVVASSGSPEITAGIRPAGGDTTIIVIWKSDGGSATLVAEGLHFHYQVS